MIGPSDRNPFMPRPVTMSNAGRVGDFIMAATAFAIGWLIGFTA